jgi:hypothetical protein
VSSSSHQSPKLSWPDGAVFAVLTILTVAFFWRMVFTDLILPRGDVFTYFYPYWAYRNAALSAGRLPLWNPFLFMGAPFLANSQAGVLYPPNWPLMWLDAPTAIKVAIVAHVSWAAIGMALFTRRTLRLSLSATTLAALVFALGGYLTAQAEHVNQLQGLAWLPWLFWLYEESRQHPQRLLWLALAIAMQLLAGHTQSAFISGIGLGVWALWNTLSPQTANQHPDPDTPAEARQTSLFQKLWPLAIPVSAAVLALGLAAAQILPTLELAALSNRGGGLPILEAVSFSLRPEIIGRAFLPSYNGSALFSEYVAYPGIAALVLALQGSWRNRRDHRTLGLIALAVLGFFLALGAYNPIYWILVRFIPGFNLFRAPARWLALWAFAAAALAGIGLDALATHPPSLRGKRVSTLLSSLWPAGVIILLAASAFFAPLSGDEVAGAVAPTLIELTLWAAALTAACGLTSWLASGRITAYRYALPALGALTAVELFVAGQSLPYNHLSAPAAWSSQRPAISTLLAKTGCGCSPLDTDATPSRFLSISDILFDPGDLREMEAIYRPHLSEEAFYDLIIATKQKEILAPNLPLAWGIPAMDGFDGGILPTRDYTRFTSLFLPAEAVSPDGRLRENLPAVPDLTWLRMTNVRWIITDKVADLWVDGAYYDLQFPARLAAPPDPSTPPLAEAYPVLPFEATTVGIIGYVEGTEGLPDGTQIGSVAVFYEGGEFPLVQPLLAGRDLAGGAPDSPAHTRIVWPEAERIERVEVSIASGFPGVLVVQGITLIDDRSGAFMVTTLSQGDTLRLAYAAEVKIYEYQGTLPRAYLACNPVRADSQEEAWGMLQAGSWPVVEDTSPTAQISCNPNNPGLASTSLYEPERVEILAESRGENVYLILSDAWYPGWQATLDGQPVPILRANGMFRAVHVPPGQHEIVFTYRSKPFEIGTAVSIACLLTTIIGLAIFRPKKGA